MLVSLFSLLILSPSFVCQENLEHCLHQSHSRYLQRYTAFCSVLSVSNSGFHLIIYTYIGMNCFFFFVSASVGLSFLQFTNMNSMRNLFITGVSLFMGLSVPDYFREYTAKALHGPAHTSAGWVSFLLKHYPFQSFFLSIIDKLLFLSVQ